MSDTTNTTASGPGSHTAGPWAALAALSLGLFMIVVDIHQPARRPLRPQAGLRRRAGRVHCGSLGAGLSTGVETLVTARAVQGLGAALLTPQTLTLTTHLFRDGDRGRAMGMLEYGRTPTPNPESRARRHRDHDRPGHGPGPLPQSKETEVASR
ncbi:hypothetical protein [Streptomyces sp. NPDC088400]|uniref:hypothetical protein n=1 Tax=Streptomyces sp. NPDC088400 TaxID=3365861 RepID=UPI0037F47B98